MLLKRFAITIVKSLFSLFLIMVIFSLFANFSFKDIITNTFGDIYDYSNKETRDNVLTNLIESCNEEEISLDEAKINKLCEEYNKNEISDRDFFTGILSSVVPEELDTDKIGINLSWLKIINKYSLLILTILFVLLILLHMGNFKGFFKVVGGILFSQGIFIILPYLFLKIYISFSQIDTSFILDSVIEGTQPELQTTVIKLLPLIFLRIYTLKLIIITAVLLAVGLTLKIIFRKSSASNS